MMKQFFQLVLLGFLAFPLYAQNFGDSNAFAYEGHFNVKSFGAKGDNSTDDAAAIQAAMDAAKAVQSTGGGTVYFPPGTYKVGTTLAWPQSVNLLCGSGNATAGLYTRILWGGALGGTLMEAETTGVNWHQTSVSYCGFAGPSSGNTVATLINFPDRVDYGTTFWRCAFIGSTGNAIQLQKGATNFYMYDFRADGIGGYFLWADVNTIGVTNLTLQKFTLDTSSGPATGLIHFDGSTAANNIVNHFSVRDANIEYNAALAGTDDAFILLEVNTSITNVMQFWVDLSNVYVGGDYGSLEGVSLIRSKPTADQIGVVGINTRVSGQSTDFLISGTTTAGPLDAGQFPLFVFAPFTTGSPVAENSIISLISRVELGGSLTQNLDTVTFSATPEFDAAVANIFKITLTGNVTSSTFVNEEAGQDVKFIICQDATGSHTFVWPTEMRGEGSIGSTLNTCSIQDFVCDGTDCFGDGITTGL